MTKEQLEKEARKLYRLVYSRCISADYSHKISDEYASRAYDAYIERFQSHVAETQPEPVSNTDELPQFVPDWSKLEYDTCVQYPDGEVWNCEIPPFFYEDGDQWIITKGKIESLGRFALPDWKTAYWQRPTE